MINLLVPNIKASRSAILTGWSLAAMLIFLQEGYNYYLSVQVLAVFCLAAMILMSKPKINNFGIFILIMLSMAAALFLSAMFSPFVVSRSSPNIYFTVLATIVYASCIIILPVVVPQRVNYILHSMYLASGLTIVGLSIMMLVSELSVFDGVSRVDFLLQNERLVTNFASRDSLLSHVNFAQKFNLPVRIDLFYGEPSYLAIVLLCCLLCYTTTYRMLDQRSQTINGTLPGSQFIRICVVLMGAACLFYLKSLSSVIYALIVLFFVFKGYFIPRLTVVRIILFVLAVIAMIALFSDRFDYLVQRITMEDSLSVTQRFGSFQEFTVLDYIIGLKDEALVPEAGFHNGLIFVIAISGIAGIFYLGFLFGSAAILARKLNIATFTVLVILATTIQNGAIFSPNKIVLFAFILLPFTCVRHLNTVELKRKQVYTVTN